MPFQNRILKPDKSFSQDLSADALSYTSNYARRFKLESVNLRASVAISEAVEVWLDSHLGANYDVRLAYFEFVSEQDFIFRPQGEANYQSGDEIRVTCTNANLTGTVYGHIKASELTQ